MHGGMKPWQITKKKADAYWSQIVEILRQVAGHIIEVREATPTEDKHSATDYVVTVSSGDICCRVRLKWQYWLKHGDFTVRTSRPSGRKTEMEKLREGFGRWYLYAWSRPNKQIGAWVFVDLDAARGTGIIYEDWPTIPNEDGSSFFGYKSLDAFQRRGCIVAAGGEALKKGYSL